MRTPEQRAADKAARRERNRLEWQNSPRNVHVAREAAKVATVLLPADSTPGPSDNRALQKLRKLMADVEAPLHRRLEAGETILSFELAAGSLANLPIEEVEAPAYRFLRMVAEASDVPPPLQVRALKALAGVESSRARAADANAEAERRHLLISLVNACRSTELRRLGSWPEICSRGEQWALKGGDQFDTPQGARTTESISAALDGAKGLGQAELARRRQARRSVLLQIEATNRSDRWRDLASDAAAD